MTLPKFFFRLTEPNPDPSWKTISSQPLRSDGQNLRIYLRETPAGEWHFAVKENGSWKSFFTRKQLTACLLVGAEMLLANQITKGKSV